MKSYKPNFSFLETGVARILGFVADVFGVIGGIIGVITFLISIRLSGVNHESSVLKPGLNHLHVFLLWLVTLYAYLRYLYTHWNDNYMKYKTKFSFTRFIRHDIIFRQELKYLLPIIVLYMLLVWLAYDVFVLMIREKSWSYAILFIIIFIVTLGSIAIIGHADSDKLPYDHHDKLLVVDRVLNLYWEDVLKRIYDECQLSLVVDANMMIDLTYVFDIDIEIIDMALIKFAQQNLMYYGYGDITDNQNKRFYRGVLFDRSLIRSGQFRIGH